MKPKNTFLIVLLAMMFYSFTSPYGHDCSYVGNGGVGGSYGGSGGGGVFGPPTAITYSATNVNTMSVTLNGLVNPNGNSTSAFFEWGTNPTNPTTTFNTTATQSIGSGQAMFQ